MSKVNLFKALTILGFIYFMTPKGSLITSGSYIAVYKISISILCAGAIFYFCNITKTTISLSLLEFVAIISNVFIMFPTLSQHFPMIGFEIFMLNYDNYHVIPYYLFLMQLLCLGISRIGRLGIRGYYRKAKSIVVYFLDCFRINSNDLFLSFRWR